MKVSVEAISPAKKSVRIEVPSEAVTHAFNHVLTHLQERVQIPGFRKGKTPLALLTQKYEAALESDALEALIREYYPRGIEEAGLAPIATPHFQDIHFQKDAPLSFTALVDVMPKIEPLHYKGLTLPHETVAVTEYDVDQALEKLREQQGYLETLPEDHSIVASDYVMIGFTETSGAKRLKGESGGGGGGMRETLVQMGAETTRAEVQSALMDKKKGETVSVDLVLPQEDSGTAGGGKCATRFNLTVKEIKTKKLPALDDELAKDLGRETLSDLKEAVKNELLAARTARMRSHQRERLIRRLIELHPTEAPQPMVEREFECRKKEMPLPLQSDTKVLAILREKAEEGVKAYLILSAIADEEKIEASEDQIEEHLKQSARKKGIPLERERRTMMQSEETRYAVARTLRIEQALERVYSLAQYVE